MQNREIKFRANETHTGFKVTGFYVTFLDMSVEGSPRVHAILDDRGHWTYVKPETVMQYTGLKDKNSPNNSCVYEKDIVNYKGIIIGNYYENRELLQDETNLLIDGFGTANWRATEEKAMARGCFYPE